MLHVTHEEPHASVGSAVFDGRGEAMADTNALLNHDQPMFFSTTQELKKRVDRGVRRATQRGQPVLDSEDAVLSIQDLTNAWKGTQTSLMKTVMDLFTACVDASHQRFVNESTSSTKARMTDLTDQADKTRTTWRANVMGLERRSEALKTNMAQYAHDRQMAMATVAAAQRAVHTWTPAGRSAMAIHDRVSKNLKEARVKQTTDLARATKLERDRCTSVLHAFAEACAYTLRKFHVDLASVKQDGDAIARLIDINSASASPKIATRVASLKHEFQTRMVAPLKHILGRHGVDGDVLLDLDMDDDVFGIDMCLAIEDALRRVLGHHYNVHIDPVDDATVIQQRTAELRRTLQDIQDAKQSELMNMTHHSAAALKALSAREQQITKQLDGINTTLQQQTVARDTQSPHELLQVVQATLRMCRELRAGVESARQAEATMRHIAVDHTRTSAATLHDTAVRSIRAAEHRAMSAMDTMARELHTIQQQVDEATDTIMAIDSAHRSFRVTGSLSSTEHKVLHHLEEVAQLDTVIADTQKHLMEVERLISLGTWLEWAWKRLKRRIR